MASRPTGTLIPVGLSQTETLSYDSLVHSDTFLYNLCFIRLTSGSLSIYTPATTRCSSCLRVPPLIHSLLICTRGSARPGAATP